MSIGLPKGMTRDEAYIAGIADGESAAMTLFTVSVDSEDIDEGEWNDLLYVWAPDEETARWLSQQHVRSLRQTAHIEETEAHAYKGDAKVLAAFDPNEED